MRLHFLGAAQEVTGSAMVLETGQGTLLVDCGLFQGRRAEAEERNRSLPALAVGADAALLTHAHVDHSGSLPTLVKRGFQGAIHATPATRDVAALMLADSARIQAADAEYLNRTLRDDPRFVPIEPIYDEDDVADTLARFVGVPYHRQFSPLPGVLATFLDAGHILGSAQVLLQVHDGGDKRRILLTGDLGRPGLPILRDPERPPRPLDHVVMESTYGARVHGSVASMHDELARVVNETAARGGKLIVPSFALGRTQEILYVLHELQRAGRLPAIPIYVDSPLATSVTAVFRLHPDCFDRATRRMLQTEGDPFGVDGLVYTATREDSMAINEREGPAIVIAGSGMAESGRVVHHLRRAVEDRRNTIAIVGFMAQHTLGRRLAERRPTVRVLGIERELHAHVEVLDVFSAHADRDGLLAHAEACGTVRRFFLVHGEPEQQEPLRAELERRGTPVTVPERFQAVELE